MSRRAIAAILLACALLPAAAAAQAPLSKCVVSASGVHFGRYAGAEASARGEIVLDCNGGGSLHFYLILLSTGASGSYAGRMMSSRTGMLGYNLYKDAAHTAVWGDGTGGSQVAGGVIDLRRTPQVSIINQVFGLVPGGQSSPPAHYSDTIVITVFY